MRWTDWTNCFKGDRGGEVRSFRCEGRFAATLAALIIWHGALDEATAGDGGPGLARSSELADILQRPVRAISYPSNSNMGIFFALAVPLEDPANSVSLSYFFEASYGLPDNASIFGESSKSGSRRKRAIDRSTVYAVLRNKFESAGFPGHECLLRSICETSEYPLEHNGMLGDVFHVVFTPSTSRPEDHLPDGIVEAELKGRNGSCDDYYSLCPLGLFDLIGILR